MSRLNRILTIALIAQLVIAAAIFLPRIFPAGAESAPLFGALKVDDITRFSVQDMDGNQVELARQGEAWVVPSSEDYPADAAEIKTFLDKLVAVQTNPLVTRTSASHKRLQVADADFVRRLDFTLADSSTRTLFIGSTGAGGAAHVRAGGQAEVYQARDLYSYDAAANVANWIDPVYFTIAQDRVVSLTLQNANGAFEFEKDSGGNWTMKGLKSGEEFNADNLTALLSRLASLQMTQPLGKQTKPEYGLEQPGAVITLTTTDDAGASQASTLRIGAKDAADNSYVISSSESPYIVRVAGFNIEDFVTRTQQDFLKQATPTPTPAAALDVTPTLEITPTPEITPTAEVTPTLALTSTIPATPRPTP